MTTDKDSTVPQGDLVGLGAFIRDLRGTTGLAEVAQRAGVNASYLASLERGRYQPSRHVLRQVADALGIPAGVILHKAGLAPAEAGNPGHIVREYRLARGMRQTDLARAIGVRQNTISVMESGTAKLSPWRLRQISAVLAIPPAFLGLAQASHTGPSGHPTPGGDPDLRRRADQLAAELTRVTRLLAATQTAPIGQA